MSARRIKDSNKGRLGSVLEDDVASITHTFKGLKYLVGI